MDHKLKNRWFENEGIIIYESLVKNSFDVLKVKNLNKHEGKWDLRGITFPQGTSLKSMNFEAVDFSYSTFYESSWEKCKFKEVIFYKVKADYNKFWACHFMDSTFKDSFFNSSLMNGYLDEDPGSFQRVRFISTNLTGTIYNFPLMRDCNFDNCKLDKVDFNGSRFEHCKFVGKLNEVIFRGHPLINKKLYPNIKTFPNKMINVDFRNATLSSVLFIDQIDLSSCVFPEGDNYLIIDKKRLEIFEEARRVIEMQWEGMQKKIGLAVINDYYLSNRNKNLQFEVIDRESLIETNKSFGELFFSLLKRLKESVS